MNVRLLSVQSCAIHGQHIKYVCVCVSIILSVNSPTGQTLMDFYSTVDSLKDADLRKDVPFGVLMMNNHV